MVTFSNSLTINPENEKARKQLEKLSDKYSSLLLDYAQMTGPLKKNLETEYMMKIGCKEYELYSLHISIMQIRRKIAAHQAAINDGSSITEEEIEQIIAKEFSEYKRVLEEHQKAVQKAEEHFGAPKMTVVEHEKLMKLYKGLVKKLHPDIHPNLPPAAANLLKSVIDAYKSADLAELELINDMVNDILKGKDVDLEIHNSLELMQKQIENLKQKISDLKNNMKLLGKKIPYRYKKLLDDSSAVLAKRKELEQQIDEYKSVLSQLQEYYGVLRSQAWQKNRQAVAE